MLTFMPHEFLTPYARPAWPPHVPELRVSPPDDEPTAEQRRVAVIWNLARRCSLTTAQGFCPEPLRSS